MRNPELLLYNRGRKGCVRSSGIHYGISWWFYSERIINCSNYSLTKARQLWIHTLRDEEPCHSSRQATEGEGILEQMVKKGDDIYYTLGIN